MSDTDNTFLLSSYLEIRALLLAAQSQGTLLRMYTENHTLALVTTLLDIDDDSQSIIVDNSADEAFNRRLVQAKSVSFEAMLDKVRIVFTSAGAQPCIHDQRPALRLPFPENMQRVQRREFYRVDIPITVSALATIPRPYHSITTFPIKDISAGGLSLIDDVDILDATPSAMYHKCTLTLPDAGQVITDLQVKRCHDVILPNGKTARSIGFQFVNLPNPMHIQVQNFIGRLERKLNARFHGLD